MTLIRPHDDNGPNGVNAFPACTLYKAHSAIIEVLRCSTTLYYI